MLSNITTLGKHLLRWIVAEPLFLLLILALWRVRLLPSLREIRTADWSNAKREFDEFVASYRVSRVWWFSSLFGAMFAATIGGSSGGLMLSVLAFSIFVVPPIIYYRRYSPFGLRCEYLPVDGNQSEGQQVCRPTNGVYTVLLEVETGANVRDYQLDVHTPSGATVDSIDGNIFQLDNERQVLYGVAEEDPEVYTEALYIEKTGSISPDGELVLIKSQGDGNTIEWIRLLPPGSKN